MQACIQRRLLGVAAFSTCPRCARPRHPSSSTSQYHYDPSSSRARKRRRPSPSKELIEALDSLSSPALQPAVYPNKPNLSYTNASTGLSDALDGPEQLNFASSTSPPSPSNDAPPRLQQIVASAIRQHGRNSTLSTGVQSSTSKSALHVLAAKNYSTSDVDQWASILTQPNLTQAAKLLHKYTVSDSSSELSSPKPVPLFVLLFLLRRPPSYVSPMAMVHLLSVAQYELQRRKAFVTLRNGTRSDPATAHHLRLDYPVLEKDSLFLVVVRLLRYARHTWPQALPVIVSSFLSAFSEIDLRHVIQKSKRPHKKHSIRLQLLNFRCNKLLHLLSLPPSKTPFQHNAHCRTAQFHVLEFMANHKPPLTVSRVGFRAVIRLHLASAKTDRERDWDQLKAKSWPPWKEEKTGLDADKDVEYGLPNSLKAMRQLAGSGYPFKVWEKVAQVLAGWDLDGSPTVQTRSYLLQHNSSHAIMSGEPNKSPEVWAARIRSTRTVQEAWAAFMAHRDRALPPSRRIYFAMLEKLAATTLLTSHGDKPTNDKHSRPLDAGDAKETFAIPESPKDATYVRLPPPTLHQLARDMLSDGIYPGHRTLTLLLANASDLEQAISYIRVASKRNPEVMSLLSYDLSNSPQLQQVPRSLFAAFLALLYRTGTYLKSARQRSGAQSRYSTWQDHPIRHATRLLQAYQPKDIILYNQVISCLFEIGAARSKRSFHPQGRSSIVESKLVSATEMIRSFEEIDHVFSQLQADHIQPDAENFRLLCQSLSSLVLATQELRSNPFSANYLRHTPQQLKHRIHSKYAPRIYSLFTEIFHGDRDNTISADINSLPRLLSAPVPAVLHSYARLLGQLYDYNMMIRFANWMKTHSEEINATAAETRNGERMLRNCHVAFRAFTESDWSGDYNETNNNDAEGGSAYERLQAFSSQSTESGGSASASRDDFYNDLPASENVRGTLKYLVESAGWEWPSDEEVDAYVEKRKVTVESDMRG